MRLYTDLSDMDLVDLLKSGDQLAFTELLKRYNRLLFIHAYKLLKDKEDARDLVQEIFIAIWDSRESISAKTNFAGFLYASIRNKVLNLIIHKKVEHKYLNSLKDYIEKGEAQTDYLARTRELQSIIEREIQFLPPKMREIFELSRYDNLSHKQISEKLNLSEKTVKKQVNNALKILRVKLGLLAYLYFILHN
jgi:RNA polymerase sigma-70 factor (family 1)